MNAITLTVEVDPEIKERLDTLARDTGRDPSHLAAEALEAYLDVRDWQASGIRAAIDAVDRGQGVAHDAVKSWVESWGRESERPRPKHTAR